MLVKFSFGSCVSLIENIDELGYVRVAFDVSLLRVSVRGLAAELLKPVETPQVQFLAKVLQHTI